jgi:hypothetical protein
MEEKVGPLDKKDRQEKEDQEVMGAEPFIMFGMENIIQLQEARQVMMDLMVKPH